MELLGEAMDGYIIRRRCVSQPVTVIAPIDEHSHFPFAIPVMGEVNGFFDKLDK
jgi:hypothetical protein